MVNIYGGKTAKGITKLGTGIGSSQMMEGASSASG